MTTRQAHIQRAVIYPLGAMWVARGAITLLVTELPDTALPHQMVSEGIRAGLWIATGLGAIVLAWMHHRHAIPVLIVMPAAMAASYLLDAFASLTPPNPPGQLAAWPQLVYWVALTWMLWIMSGWRIVTRPPGSESEDIQHVAGNLI